MEGGLRGRLGPSVRPSVIVASRPESDSATPPPRSTGAAVAPGHTYRRETATPIPAQVNTKNCNKNMRDDLLVLQC